MLNCSELGQNVVLWYEMLETETKQNSNDTGKRWKVQSAH